MRGISGGFGALVASALVCSSAHAQQALLELPPASDWVMNYDDDSCALQRVFGNPGQQVHLEMRRYGPREALQVVIASRDFTARSNRFGFGLHAADSQLATIQSPFAVSYGEGMEGILFEYSLARSTPGFEQSFDEFVQSTPALDDRQRDMLRRAQELSRELGSPGARLVRQKRRELDRLTLSDEYLALQRRTSSAFEQSDPVRELVSQRAERATGLAVAGRFDIPLMLRTGSLRAPLAAMEDCLAELMGHWGIDVGAHAGLTRPAEPLDFDRLVREIRTDFPGSMRGTGVPGLVNLRISVSENGEPTACHVQAEMSDEAFRRRACDNMMEFARFYPALDANGQAIASFFQITVAYLGN